MRDYAVIVGARNGAPHTDLHRYLFVGCAEAECRTGVRPEVFAASLGDEFVHAGPDHPDPVEPGGFIWGVRWSCAYPGLTYAADGERARHWSRLLGRTMHEVTLETNAFFLRLVFAELRYAFLGHDESVLPPKEYPVAPTASNTARG